MPWKDVIECLQAGEGADIEFLNSVPSVEHLLKFIIGFLNNKGGKIIIGIDDKNDLLVGSNVSKGFIDLALQKIDPIVYLNIEEINRLDKTVLFIKVPDGPEKPYAYRGKFYFRQGDDVKRVTKEEIFPMVGQEKSIKLNNRQEKTLQYLKENQEITNRLFRDMFNVSHKTAHLELTELLNRNLLAKHGKGRNTAYKLKG